MIFFLICAVQYISMTSLGELLRKINAPYWDEKGIQLSRQFDGIEVLQQDFIDATQMVAATGHGNVDTIAARLAAARYRISLNPFEQVLGDPNADHET